MTDPHGRTLVDAALLGGVAVLVRTLFGVELQTLACALVGAWIGAPLVKRLDVSGETLALAPTWPDKAWRALKAVLSYVAAAIASAVFATLMAGDPGSPGSVGLRNALAVGIGIGFYVLVAKFVDDPVGTIAGVIGRFLPRRDPPPPPSTGGSS